MGIGLAEEPADHRVGQQVIGIGRFGRRRANSHIITDALFAPLEQIVEARIIAVGRIIRGHDNRIEIRILRQPVAIQRGDVSVIIR